MRFLIVNKSPGPRTVRTVDKGVRTLRPGRQLTAEIADAHLAWLEGAGLALEPVEDAVEAQAAQEPPPWVEEPAAPPEPAPPPAAPDAPAVPARRKKAR